MIRTLLVDDHTLVRQILAERLIREPDLEVVGQLGSADDLPAEVSRLKPHVVVLDIDLPGRNCFEAARAMRRLCPETCVLFLSAFCHDAYIAEALAVGAGGYLTKNEPLEVLIEALRAVNAGRACYSRDVRSRMVVDETGARLSSMIAAQIAMPTLRELRALGHVAQQLTGDGTSSSGSGEGPPDDERTSLQHIFNGSSLLMGVVELTTDDRDIIHTYDNPATLRFFGRSGPGSSAGQRARELGAPADAVARWIAHYRESEAQGRPVHFEYEHRNGQEARWLAVAVNYVGPGPTGRTRFCYAAENVTERIRAERLAQDSEQRLRILARALPGVILRCDVARPWHVEDVTDEIEHVTGYPARDFLSHARSYEDLVHPDDLPAVARAIEVSIAERTPHQIEYRIRHADGGLRWVRVTTQVLYDANRTRSWLESVILDVTERQQAEAAARETAGRLATLTEREREVLNQMVAGAVPKQIAARLGLAVRTVQLHRVRLMEKLGTDSLADLVRMMGIVRPTCAPP